MTWFLNTYLDLSQRNAKAAYLMEALFQLFSQMYILLIPQENLNYPKLKSRNLIEKSCNKEVSAIQLHVLVDQNNNLSDIELFTYLKYLLTGQVLEFV